MIGLVGLLGGAALEIRRVARRGKRDEEGASQAAELRKAVEQYAKQLEQERRAAATAARKAEALQEEADSLARQREALAAQNAELLLTNTSLGEASARLEEEKTALVATNRRLTEQMEALSVARDDEAARFAADMGALRDKVADVLQRMFSNDIDEPAAVEALRDLGCEVRFVPGARRAASGPSTSGASYEFKPQLLLEDPAKIARLMQAARMQAGGASPRLLEGGGMAAAGLTPRSAAAQQPRIALTIGGGTGGSGGGSAVGGSPSFVLSWLGGSTTGSGGGAAAPGTAAALTAQAPAAAAAAHAQDAVKGVAKGKDAAPAPAAPAAARSSPSKSGRRGGGMLQVAQEQDGNLVFAPAGKAKGGKSRMGLSLSDASSMLKLGGGSSSSGGNGGAPAPGVYAPLPGSVAGGGSDVSASKDLVLSHRA